jgi:hypothetical protein
MKLNWILLAFVLLLRAYFADPKDKCENNGPQTVYWLSAAGMCKINWPCSPFVTYAAA